MREHYLGGREHAAIKHFFLRQYLEPLAFKTLQTQRGSIRTFAYIDGFTGPWAAKDDEEFSDTSFGVALDVFRRVKASLPNIEIRCVFCESRRSAFQKLNAHVIANSEGIITKCVHGRFEDHISDITDFIGKQGFLFAFIDPKGWNVNSAAITPLLKDRWAEVLFNFMAEFINRFPDYEKVKRAYASLLSDVDWRARFEATPTNLSNDDRVLLLFRGVLKDRWDFSHVLELPIRKPHRDRVFYKLVYGTRSPHGVLAFREAQAKAEREGFAVAVEAAQGHQTRLFSSDEEAGHIAASVGIGSARWVALLRNSIEARLDQEAMLEFITLAADVLEGVPAREKDVRSVLRSMRDEGLVRFVNLDGRGDLRRRSKIQLQCR